MRTLTKVGHIDRNWTTNPGPTRDDPEPSPTQKPAETCAIARQSRLASSAPPPFPPLANPTSLQCAIWQSSSPHPVAKLECSLPRFLPVRQSVDQSQEDVDPTPLPLSPSLRSSSLLSSPLLSSPLLSSPVLFSLTIPHSTEERVALQSKVDVVSVRQARVSA